MTEYLKDIPSKEEHDEMRRDEVSTYRDNWIEMNPLKRPKSMITRRSTPYRVTEFDEESGQWRSMVKMQRKAFDDAAKGVFLEEYAKWGRMGDAATLAGVLTGTVRKALRDDEEFAEIFMVAETEYRDKLVAHHQNLVFNGQVKKTYDRNGNLVSEETIYPVRLIELELKKHDKGYREQQQLEINHSGGVLIAPAEMKTIEDWENRFTKQIVDVTPEEED